LKTSLFKDFYEVFPNKFQNKTNGVTPRRWVACCNQELAAFYTRYLGTRDWLVDLELTKKLNGKENDSNIRKEFWDIKQRNKKKLAQWVYKHTGVTINENSMFDIMIKRIHEYKRQLMNALYIIHRYLQIKDMSPQDRAKVVPRTVMFGGKAAPGYVNAKRIIKLIGGIQNFVNRDKDTKEYLKVVFLPNYNVSAAEVIIPAAELSQHISTAGTEASGTSNMKFALNGCLIIGTLDGANVEIAKEVGDENMFIFGAVVDEVEKLRHKVLSR
jgi:glycogen phosphorylase